MAIIKVENAEIIRQVGTRGAFAINEHITLPDGRSFPKTYTVWFEGNSNQYPTGSIVTVIGVYSAKLREYTLDNGTPKHAIDVSINEPQIEVLHTVKATITEETPF